LVHLEKLSISSTPAIVRAREGLKIVNREYAGHAVETVVPPLKAPKSDPATDGFTAPGHGWYGDSKIGGLVVYSTRLSRM